MDLPTHADLADRFIPDHHVTDADGWRWGIVDDGHALYVFERGEWTSVLEDDVPTEIVTDLDALAA